MVNNDKHTYMDYMDGCTCSDNQQTPGGHLVEETTAAAELSGCQVTVVVNREPDWLPGIAGCPGWWGNMEDFDGFYSYRDDFTKTLSYSSTKDM